MKNLLITLLILLLLSPLSAQEEETEITITFNLSEYVKSLGESDCETFLRQGNQYSKIAVESTMAQNWDQAFYNDEQAFESYMKAFGHCDNENKELARSRLDENQLIGKWLTCFYHTIESRNASVRAHAFLEKKESVSQSLESVTQSLKHARDSLQSLDNAIRFCTYDQTKVDELIRIRTGGVKALALILEYEEILIEGNKNGY